MKRTRPKIKSHTLVVHRVPLSLGAVAAYVRVSSESQDAAMQRAAITRACKARGHNISEFFEEKSSAKTMKRPVLEHVRQLIREGKIGLLYVWRLDRLTRSGIRDTFEVIDELQRHGCLLMSITDGFDLQGPAAEPLIAMMAWCAKMELVAGNERRAAARERILAAGGTWGRPKEMTPATELRIAALASEGRSQRAIAVAVKVPRATVGRVLRRLKSPAVNGAARAGKKAPNRKTVPPPAH